MAKRPRHTISIGKHSYEMDYVFPAEIAALRAHKTGQFQERPVLDWVRSKKLRGTYVDVGAHVGNHSLFFLEHCASTKVISIEAHPIIYKLLEGNMLRNSGRVSMGSYWDGHNKAAYDTNGEKVQMAPIPHNNAGHCHIANSGGRTGERGEVEVDTMMLDNLIYRDRVVVLKIDVEDVEEQVIKGASLVLAGSHPIIIAERHNKKQLKDFEDLIRPYNYKRTAEWSGIHTYAWE